MSRFAWILLLLASLVPSASTPAQANNGGPAVYWENVPGTRKSELYASGYKVGIWDGDTEKYYRVNVDGTTTGPVTPPWGPRKLNAPAKTESKSEPEVETPAVQEPAPPEKPWYEELPSWTAHVVGAAITLLIIGIGLAIQSRKT